MRKIIVVTFMTMDGVMQAPGAPAEDQTNGFKFGGWQFPHSDEITGNAIMKIMSKPFDLLLGRKTYEIFSAYWPYKNDTIGEKFNSNNKYVVGTTDLDLSWKNSFQIKSDVVNELKKLKQQDAPDLLVHGSSRLVQTLFDNHLIDVLHIWTHPVTLGQGKKLFREGTPAQEWKMAESAISPKGVLLATYIPGGDVRIGSFGEDKPSAAELARRERWARM
jgi:dihydrofolate reductase